MQTEPGYLEKTGGYVRRARSGPTVSGRHRCAIPVIILVMRPFGSFLLVLAFAAAFSALWGQKTPPEQIVFQSKMGNVTFNHAAHGKRANNDCKACHDKLFPQSKDPLNYKAAMHQTAETAKTSCGGCHNPGGASFATKGNCSKCHVK
jgi:c(7)-type cytochrome triheme protein